MKKRVPDEITVEERLRIVTECRYETIASAAERTTVSEKQIYRWVESGDIDHIRLGIRGIRVLTDSLNAKIASRIQLPASDIPSHLRGSARVDAIYQACYKQSAKHSNAA